MKKRISGISLLCILLSYEPCFSQRFLMDMVDTTNQVGKGILSIYQRYHRIHISGYIQPQFQITTKEGAENYDGGNFSAISNNRFMLRRGRLRVDYTHLNQQGDPTTFFVFQFDGTERGFATRDFFGRFYENKLKLFSITTGLFARPFGFEINFASATRETPERGRMSQILMRTERDVGAMLTINNRKKGGRYNNLKFDIGVFNGQGLSGPADYDGHKDVIARLGLLPTKIGLPGAVKISAGISGYAGGITSQAQILYKAVSINGKYTMQRDSSIENFHKTAPRNYVGADVQLLMPNRRGATELRAEYIMGKQTSTAVTTETPGVYPVTNGIRDPLYIRSFNGAYFYFLQHLGSEKHQFVAKYDWYDPNTKISGSALKVADGFTRADLRYNSLGVGYVYYANPNLKFTVYYNHVKNEASGLEGYTMDTPDDVLTCRVQYTF